MEHFKTSTLTEEQLQEIDQITREVDTQINLAKRSVCLNFKSVLSALRLALAAGVPYHVIATQINSAISVCDQELAVTQVENILNNPTKP